MSAAAITNVAACSDICIAAPRATAGASLRGSGNVMRSRRLTYRRLIGQGTPPLRRADDRVRRVEVPDRREIEHREIE